MNKTLSRITALLLIPALVADPCLAGTWGANRTLLSSATPDIFASQAVNAPVEFLRRTFADRVRHTINTLLDTLIAAPPVLSLAPIQMSRKNSMPGRSGTNWLNRKNRDWDKINRYWDNRRFKEYEGHSFGSSPAKSPEDPKTPTENAPEPLPPSKPDTAKGFTTLHLLITMASLGGLGLILGPIAADVLNSLPTQEASFWTGPWSLLGIGVPVVITALFQNGDVPRHAAPEPQDVLFRVGHYLITREIHSSATGKIYEAWDDENNRKVVIKEISEEHTMLIDKELMALNRLAESPHFPKLLDFIEPNRIVMEFIEGTNLRRILNDAPDKKLDPRDALNITVQVAAALEAAHRKSWIHRDIKPGNIMVAPGKPLHVTLIDWGLAGAVNETVQGGTPDYMPPEQWLNAPAIPQSDVYAAALVLYEMLTGRELFTSFRKDSEARLREMHEGLTAEAAAQIPEEVRKAGGVEVLQQALSPDPSQRQTAAELSAQCLRILQALPASDKSQMSLPHAVQQAIAVILDADPGKEKGKVYFDFAKLDQQLIAARFEWKGKTPRKKAIAAHMNTLIHLNHSVLGGKLAQEGRLSYSWTKDGYIEGTPKTEQRPDPPLPKQDLMPTNIKDLKDHLEAVRKLPEGETVTLISLLENIQADLIRIIRLGHSFYVSRARIEAVYLALVRNRTLARPDLQGALESVQHAVDAYHQSQNPVAPNFVSPVTHREPGPRSENREGRGVGRWRSIGPRGSLDGIELGNRGLFGPGEGRYRSEGQKPSRSVRPVVLTAA